MPTSHRTEHAEQLTLLDERPPRRLPGKFRLADDTRRRGLAHVEVLRRQLTEQAARQRAELLPARTAPARTGAVRHHADAA